MKNLPSAPQELFDFIKRAQKSTYAGNGKEIPNPERSDFHEFEYRENKLYYRDSYAGKIIGGGMEVVRFEKKPIWSSVYSGGMIKNEKDFLLCFAFLKKVLMTKSNFKSFRGPSSFTDKDWKYSYTQKGDIEYFSGHEEIYHKNKLVFSTEFAGGIII